MAKEANLPLCAPVQGLFAVTGLYFIGERTTTNLDPTLLVLYKGVGRKGTRRGQESYPSTAQVSNSES